jgi:hypothetical protein
MSVGSRATSARADRVGTSATNQWRPSSSPPIERSTRVAASALAEDTTTTRQATRNRIALVDPRPSGAVDAGAVAAVDL